MDVASRPSSSRFLLDSIDEGANNRACTLTLSPIKSLWERSRKASISSVSGSSPAAQAGSGDSSPQLAPPVPSLSSASSTSTPRSLTPVPSPAPREPVASSAFPSGRHPPKAPYYDTPSLSTSRLRQLHSSPSIDTMIFTQEWPHCPCDTTALVGPGPSSLASCLHFLFCTVHRSGCPATTNDSDDRKGEKPVHQNTQIQAHGQLCQLTGTRPAWGMEGLIMCQERSIPVSGPSIRRSYHLVIP